MKLRFINHSSVQIEQNGESLLMDPWLSGRIFNGAWALVNESELDIVDMQTLKYIWISHEHPDHLHFPTLKKIAAAMKNPVTVLYRKQENTNVRDAVVKLGFEFQELEDGVEARLSSGMRVTTFVNATDAALFVQGNDLNVLNLNDCILTDARMAEVALRWKQLDVLLMQFSQAGFQGNPEDEGFRIEFSRRHLLDFLQSRVSLLKPRILLPIASHSYFCVDTNFYLNSSRVYPSEVRAHVKGCNVHILRVGEELDDHKRTADADISAAGEWQQLMDGVRVLPPENIPEDAEIVRAAEGYIKFMRDRFPNFLLPGRLMVKLMNQNRFLRISVRNGKSVFLNAKQVRESADVEMPENDFLYFAKFPWGADTVAVAGSLRIRSHWRWKSHYYLRHAAYVFSHKGGYVVGLMAWMLTVYRSLQWSYDNFLFRRNWK